MSKFKGTAKQSTTTSLKEVLDTAQTEFSIPERGITEDTVKHFGIRRFMDVTSGEVDSYFFPITKKGDITGFVKVSPQRSKKNGRFTTVGDVSVDSDLIGQNMATRGKKLFIVEGTWDLLSAFQSLNNNKPEGFNGIPAVVSPALGIGDINKGVTNSRQHIANNLEFVNGYKEKIVCFDNDKGEINVGQEGVQDLALILGEFKNVLLPVNDCNDMMKEHGERELFWAFMNAKDFEHGRVVEGLGDMDELDIPLSTGIPLKCFPKLSRALHGIRPEQFIILLAPPKCGKTTVAKAIQWELMQAGQKTMGIYLEENLVKSRQSFIALHGKVSLPRFREDPSILSKEVKDEAKAIINGSGVLFYDDRKGKMTPDNVIDILNWGFTKGCTAAILDHTSFVISGDARANEVKVIDNMLTEIAAFVKRTTMTVIAIAHIRRTNDVKPKGRDGKVEYPYWYRVYSDSGRGSGAFEQVCTTLLAIEKEVHEDGHRGLARIRVLEDRDWDYTGEADTFSIPKPTGQILLEEEEMF